MTSVLTRTERKVLLTHGESFTLKQIDEVRLSEVVRRRQRPVTYLNLIATSSSLSTRKATRVLVSKRRGHIFIQTDQPLYNPMQPGSKKKQTQS